LSLHDALPILGIWISEPAKIWKNIDTCLSILSISKTPEINTTQIFLGRTSLKLMIILLMCRNNLFSVAVLVRIYNLFYKTGRMHKFRRIVIFKKNYLN